jgi:RNA polymerase sigma factor (sigma-70 family)
LPGLRFQFRNFLLMPHDLEHDQEALVRRIADGDGGALRELYDRLCRPLYLMAFKVLSSRTESEEVVQDVFVSVWEHAHKFDSERSKVFTWLSMLVRNRCIDKMRANRCRLPAAQPDSTESKCATQQIHMTTAADELQARERAQHIRKAIHQLPPEQREAITMAFFKGMTHSQIAESLGISLGTTKSRIRYGFERLSKLLPEERARSEPHDAL